MMKTLHVLFCLLVSIGAQAQWSIKSESNTPDEAFIVLNGDTLVGEVDYAKRIFGGHLNIIRFKSEDGSTARYRASDISAFAIHGQMYESAKHDGYHYFFRKAVDGNWPLFYLERHFHKRSSVEWRNREAGYTSGRELQVYFHDGQALQRLYRNNFKARIKRTLPATQWSEKELDRYEWYRVEDLFEAINN